MNSVEKELFGYINGTERMSGFDSYDSYEGDMSYFDNDDMSYFDNDDMSYASGPGAQSVVSDPYVIQYTNTTTNTFIPSIIQSLNFGVLCILIVHR